MSAVLERRKPTITRKASSDPLARLDAFARLDALRKEIRSATVELRRVEEHRARCEEDAERHREVAESVPEHQARLTELHERRARGRKVTDKELTDAETAVTAAINASKLAESAALGAVGAAGRYAEQVEQVQAKLDALTAKAKRLQVQILHVRALESRGRYRAACEKFMVDYAKHFAEVSAGHAAAHALGIESLAIDDREVMVPPTGPIDLLTSEISILPWAEGATQEERIRERGQWSFDIAETVEEQVEPMVRDLVKELKVV